jgi:DNA/RNA-binding domain of Phe-tRNA-synthetase-like protein
LHKNELYSEDNTRILATKLDHWHNKTTKVTAKTNTVLIHMDILPPMDARKMKEINKELKDLITTFCNGSVKELTLDKGTLSGTI